MTSRLTDHEIEAALRTLRFQSLLLEKDQALDVLAAVRQETTASPTEFSCSG